MIEIMTGLPNGVVGVKVSGKVSADDYKRFLDPAIDAAIDESGKISALIALEDDVDMTAGAAWQDTKLGLKHPLSWDRIAVLSEKSRWDRLAPLVSALMPGQVKHFHSDQEAEALEWLASI